MHGMDWNAPACQQQMHHFGNALVIMQHVVHALLHVSNTCMLYNQAFSMRHPTQLCSLAWRCQRPAIIEAGGCQRRCAFWNGHPQNLMGMMQLNRRRCLLRELVLHTCTTCMLKTTSRGHIVMRSDITLEHN